MSPSRVGGARPPFRKLLVANRSEIAIRVLRAASELGIRTVAIYSHEDRFALHRFKADQAFQVGKGKEPVAAYLDIDDVLRVAHDARVDAIHPGYGFLSENPDFAEACAKAGITFIGPKPDVMRRLGSKVEARALAEEAGIPGHAGDRRPASRRGGGGQALAEAIGYPIMAKASWGGGGRGMRVVEERRMSCIEQVAAGRREAKAAFGNDEIFLEKLVRQARHVEVQILGDTHGNVYPPLRARLLDAAAQSEDRRARAGALPERGQARRALRRRGALARPPATNAPARSSSSWMRRPTRSTSSRSTRASRSSTR